MDKRRQKIIRCYSKSNPVQKGLGKRMMEIWKESAKFDIRLADQTRLTLKRVWGSDLEILEVGGQVNRDKYTQGEYPKQTETQNIEQ